VVLQFRGLLTRALQLHEQRPSTRDEYLPVRPAATPADVELQALQVESLAAQVERALDVAL
jgi:hypothetical protein